jgi:RNA-directed DNA polymerase
MGGSFGFSGFDLREAKNRRGKRFILRTPKRKKQQELLRRVSGILKHSQHRKVKEVISLINPVIVGWMNYFRVGNCARVFDRLRYEVMKKVRRFVMRQRVRHGFGWKRWSNEAIYKDWGLVWNYQVQYFYRSPAKVLPAQ